MNLLLYVNPNEPVTQVLLQHQKDLDVTPLFLKDFIDNAEVFDEFDEKETIIRWKLPNIGEITNSKQTYLINRASYIPQEWFSDFHKEDLEYASNEFWAYLIFALRAFPLATDYPGPGGPAGQNLPLVQQWKKVSQSIAGLSSPKYYFGPLEMLPKEWEGQTVFTSPYKIYYWRIGPCEKEMDNVFGIRKPKGTPVLAFYIDSQVQIFLEENATISDDKKERVELFAKKTNQLFGYFCSEMLFFVDDDQVCFGMIHSCPWGAARSQNFEQVVVDTFEKIFSSIET